MFSFVIGAVGVDSLPAIFEVSVSIIILKHERISYMYQLFCVFQVATYPETWKVTLGCIYLSFYFGQVAAVFKTSIIFFFTSQEAV